MVFHKIFGVSFGFWRLRYSCHLQNDTQGKIVRDIIIGPAATLGPWVHSEEVTVWHSGQPVQISDLPRFTNFIICRGDGKWDGYRCPNKFPYLCEKGHSY